MEPARELIADGREALHRGDGAAARAAFESALEISQAPEILEGISQAAYLQFDFAASIGFLERAYAGYRAHADHASACRSARQLAFLHGVINGNGAVMQGWTARAQTLVDEVPDSSERGWVALTIGMWDGDRPSKERRFQEALDVARRTSDRDLEFVTLAYYGASLVHGGRIEEGMVRLDEACAAVAGREVEDFLMLEEIFCQLFSACEHAHDVVRADQWIAIADEIASRRRLPSVSAFCRTHYGGILTAAGRWPEADAALTEAVRIWGLGYGGLRSGALVRLADLRVRQGRLEEAEQLLEGLDGDTEAARPLAALNLARGKPAIARAVIERALRALGTSDAAAGPLLALLVEVQLATGDVPAAAAAVDSLVALSEAKDNAYLRAVAALSRGRVCLASGEGDPRHCLEEALSGFHRARTPMELAHARFELAHALEAEGPEVALAEAQAALDGFERLQAARHADAAAALLRRLGGPARTGPKGPDVLTQREAEILELLGHGLSNPDIADRLYISRKTVEHHVSNVLAKLGLRSRAEAAAYATRKRSAPL